ncbi:hypothetical protein DL96DRAFT_1599855 [Flagelloscypha sp. PMI_526]|nr:hypothetical protein DL96DRAFT_1599855 [Flagelloscypha sp. PMI_526]
MIFSTFLTLAVLASGKYDNGKVHKDLINRKESTWAKQKAAGKFASAQYRAIDEVVQCVNGVAVAVEGDALNTFRCNNIDLYNFKSHEELGSQTGKAGREIIIIGQADGAAFAEISTDAAIPRIWREIRVYKNFAIIGSEAEQHGIQIFDLNKVLDIDPASPVTFNPNTDLTGFYNELPIGRTHNVVVNEERDYVVSVGAQPRNSTQKSGLIFIDLADPTNPVSPGFNGDDGYVHDAQCLLYKGPDANYQGRDICYGYNEDSLTIYDVTDRANSSIISRTSYVGASYTHQGWVLDKQWQAYLLLDDELDEADGAGPGADGFPVTFIWDISDLSAPKQTGYYKSSVKSIDHNQYVHGDYTYQSNYGAGLRILDISSIPSDPTGAGVHEAAFFDIYPEDDTESGGGIVDFVGSWSSYSYFQSGYIFINTIERGGFVVKRTDV